MRAEHASATSSLLSWCLSLIWNRINSVSESWVKNQTQWSRDPMITWLSDHVTQWHKETTLCHWVTWKYFQNRKVVPFLPPFLFPSLPHPSSLSFSSSPSLTPPSLPPPSLTPPYPLLPSPLLWFWKWKGCICKELCVVRCNTIVIG